MEELIKSFDSDQLKTYFNKVVELQKSGIEFPINISDVFVLVYSQKSKATQVLKKNFIENVDYQVLTHSVENPKGGRPELEYYLTPSCFEYFIARKVREVFEVYRKVFHKSVDLLSSSNNEIQLIQQQSQLVLAAIQTMQVQQRSIQTHEQKLIELENKITKLEKSNEPDQDEYCTIMGFCRRNGKTINFSEAVQKGKIATKLSKEKNYPIKKVSDVKYGYVNSYKLSVLKQAFSL